MTPKKRLNSTGLRRFLTMATSMIGCALAIQCAQADVYAWVDPSGRVTLSDLPPPTGVRVISVVSETPRSAAARVDANAVRERAQQAEVQLLSERVRQLEREVERASYQPPPVVQYATPPMAMSGGCDYTWGDCYPWWGVPAYPIGFVVAPGRGFHHHHRFHGMHSLHAARSFHHHH